MEKTHNSDHRGFFSRLIGLTAIAGIGGTSIASSTHKVHAETKALMLHN